mgnify:CR=1 FL=1|tara:strand:+ start:289 stop:552 length:264 start_codon:yes stop_codon:yes gene_type:complete
MKTVLLPKQYKYTLKLPYTEGTKQAIKNFRKEAKGKFNIRVRGSGPRAYWSRIDSNGYTSRMYDQSLPLKYATYVRLYIEPIKETLK